VVNLELLVIDLVIKIILLAPALWLAGKALVGANANFFDAVWIIVLGTLVGAVFSYFGLSTLIALIIQLIIWLALVKHFFDTGWLKALVISILAIIFLVIIAFILLFIGIGVAFLLL
jgi:hypothetical protein